jgi:GPI mannosyltransferase 1 subunit M
MLSNKHCGFFTKNRVVFTCMTVLSLLGLTVLYYKLYGMEFINESLLYHVSRKDNRHNESVYWYLIY